MSVNSSASEGSGDSWAKVAAFAIIDLISVSIIFKFLSFKPNLFYIDLILLIGSEFCLISSTSSLVLYLAGSDIEWPLYL